MNSTLVSMAQQLLKTRLPFGLYERDAIASAVEEIAKLLGASDLDEEVAELESRMAVTIGRPTKLVDTSRGRRRRIDASQRPI